jgi:hypothetical protein
MTMDVKKAPTIWSQADRETPMLRARRDLLTTLATVTGMDAMYDAQVERIQQQPVFYDRVLKPLATTLWHTRILLEAYDYFLARCQEAGISLDQAQAAWQVHSSPAFEAELIEAESYGPNAMHMIDTQILCHLGLAPHDEMSVQDDARDNPDVE